MDNNEKEHARSLWKASQHKRQNRPQRGSRPQVSEKISTELESNFLRYDDEQRQSDAAQDNQTHTDSSGADLAALLEESAHIDAPLHYRTRKFLEVELDSGLPASALADAQQVLNIDFGVIGASLSKVPLHQLLGLESELCLQEKPVGNGQLEQGSDPVLAGKISSKVASHTLVRKISEQESSAPSTLEEPAEVITHLRQEAQQQKIGQKVAFRAQSEMQTSDLPSACLSQESDRQVFSGTASLAQSQGQFPSTSNPKFTTDDAELDELLGMCNPDLPSRQNSTPQVHITSETQMWKGAEENGLLEEVTPPRTKLKQKLNQSSSEIDLDEWLDSL